MNTITVSADQAAGLIFELFKAKPWINQGGVMDPEEDECAEAEAVRFILTIETAEGWNGASERVRRVVNSLLLDFLAKLMHPASPFSGREWQVPVGPSWRQAAVIIAAEMRRNHAHLATPH